jgi:hypothetical protein
LHIDTLSSLLTCWGSVVSLPRSCGNVTAVLIDASPLAFGCAFLHPFLLACVVTSLR